MKRWLWCVLGGSLIAGGMFAVAAGAATCTLELKKLEPQGRGRVVRGDDSMYRMTSSQSFFMQFLDKEQEKNDPRLEEFRKIVKKEPKYESDRPFRGVAELGGEKYAFAIDKKDAKSKGLNRLWFDANHNGDLTDDKPIDTEQEQAFSSTYSSWLWPQVNVTLSIDGKKVDYAFSLHAYTQTSGDFKYASVQLMAGAYREGEITLEGKKRHVVLLDFNSNGRFDDQLKIMDNVSGPNGQVYPQYGDVLLVDPDPKAQPLRGGYDMASGGNRHQVSKVVTIDGHYYDLEISHAGDKLTLTPSKVPLGYVTSPHEGFRAMLYGDQGCVNIDCGKSKTAAVPVGTWKLISYTIDQTEYPDSKPQGQTLKFDSDLVITKPAEKPKERSLLGALVESLLGSETASAVGMGPRFTTISASGTKDCPPVKVAQGETVKLPYGPPFKPVVTAFPAFNPSEKDVKQAQLQMSLIGSTGESCTDVMVGGDRPPAPKFTITAKGDVVETGTFKYG